MSLSNTATWASPFHARRCWKAAIVAGGWQPSTPGFSQRSVALRSNSPKVQSPPRAGRVHLKPLKLAASKGGTNVLKVNKEKAAAQHPAPTPKARSARRRRRRATQASSDKKETTGRSEAAGVGKGKLRENASDLADSLTGDKWSYEIKVAEGRGERFSRMPGKFNATGWGPDRLRPVSATGFPMEGEGSTEADGGPVAAAPDPGSTPNASKQSPGTRSSSRSRWTLPGFLETTLASGEDVQSARKLFARRDGDALRQPDNTNDYLPTDRLAALEGEDMDWWSRQGKWRTKIGGRVNALDVDVQPVEPLREMTVANLAHGLDRVLFNPGIHWLRDTRSGIYNYDPRIRNLLDVDLFDYAALPPYVTSSQDKELAQLVRREGKRYSGSTSSMTGMLSHVYFAISAWRQPQLKNFTEAYQGMPGGFSFGAKLPSSIVLRRFADGDDGQPRYAIDADKSSPGDGGGGGDDSGGDNSNYVLTQLGKSMEKMLTSSPEQYERYLRINSHQLSEEERSRPEAYHYAKSDKFVMRSQLDCWDERLPRKSFDLKTRAVIAVRQDRANWVESSGYQIRHATGLFESFEREMWDMNRSAFLKYYFQARIGHMDGIFVAFHSTASMFGFQYIPLEDMADRVFGSLEMGEQAFRLSIGIAEKLLDAATELYPNDTLKITLDAEQSHDPVLNVFVEPDRPEEEEAMPNNLVEKERDAASHDRTADVGKDGDKAREPKIVQLQVSFDRYLSDARVTGPVDFSAPQGRSIDHIALDEIERRRHSQLPSLEWSLEYAISPCPHLTEGQVRQNLAKVRKRQEAVAPLLMPNVEAINEREEFRERELGKNPEALKRFLEDRRSGAAKGMPLAPGQNPIRGEIEGEGAKGPSGEDGTPDKVDAGAGPDAAAAPDRANDTKWKKINESVLRLRRLAKLGREDAEKREDQDRLEMYERRGD